VGEGEGEGDEGGAVFERVDLWPDVIKLFMIIIYKRS
jgi:hypothetical protein